MHFEQTQALCEPGVIDDSYLQYRSTNPFSCLPHRYKTRQLAHWGDCGQNNNKGIDWLADHLQPMTHQQ